MPDIDLNSQWYYSSNGKDYGPVSWSIIESMVDEDRLSVQDLVLQAGTHTHLRIEEVEQRMSSPRGLVSPGTAPTIEVPEQAQAKIIPSVPHVEAPVSKPAPWPDLGNDTPDTSAESDEYRLGAVPESPPLAEDAYLPRHAKPAKPTKTATARIAAPITDDTPDADSTEHTVQASTFAPDVLSLSPQQLRFALEAGVIWALTSAVLLIVGSQMGTGFRSMALFVSSCLMFVLYNVVAATAAQMLKREQARQATVTSRESWEFALERISSLVISPLMVAFGAGSLFAIVCTLIDMISHAGSIGALAGGVLFIPTFLLIVGACCMLIGASLVPVVMGLADCGPSEALHMCQERHQNSYVRWLLDCLAVFSRIAPLLLLSLVITLTGLTGAVWLTVDLGIVAEFNFSFVTFLRLASYLIAFAAWLAFAFVLVTTHLVARYREAN